MDQNLIFIILCISTFLLFFCNQFLQYFCFFDVFMTNAQESVKKKQEKEKRKRAFVQVISLLNGPE